MSFRPTRMASSLSYYGLFAIVPVLVISFWIGSVVVGVPSIGTELIHRTTYFFSPEAMEFIQQVFAHFTTGTLPLIPSLIAVIALIILAEQGANELKQSLDDIWKSQKRKRGFLNILSRFSVSILFVLLFGVSFVVFITFANFFQAGFFTSERFAFLQQFSFLVTPVVILAITFIGTLISWIVLPETKFHIKTLLVGALLTSFLLTIGNIIIGLYFTYGVSLSAYGVAGSIVAVLLWCYYSALIFLFGASFAWVYNQRVIEN
jgi:membrane protein